MKTEERKIVLSTVNSKLNISIHSNVYLYTIKYGIQTEIHIPLCTQSVYIDNRNVNP